MTQPKRIYLAGPEVFFPAGDNLMIEGGIRESGGQLFVAERPGVVDWNLPYPW